MTLKWKDNDEIKSDFIKSAIDISDLSEVDSLTRENMTLGEMRRQSPRKWVIKKEKWCNGCNNAETAIRNIKKLSHILNKGYTQIVLKCIRENNLKQFTIKDLLKLLKAENLTEGSLQRKALAVLTCLGYIKKDIQRYKNKNNEVKIRYIFSLNDVISPTPCYDSRTDSHSDNWSSWRETKYFD